MIRRIVLTMLLLVSALLVTAVAPLGLLMAGREHASFQMETVMSAQTLALAAEKGLSGQSTGPVLTAPVVHARAPSDEVWVFNAAAHLVKLRFGGARRENVPVPPGTVSGVMANIEHGKTLVEQHCTRCHDTGVYSRPDRRVGSLEALKNQVKR